MSTADEVFELFRAANPVVDVAGLHARRPPAPRHIAGEGPTDLVVRPLAPPVRRRRWLVAAAIVAAALVAGGVWLTRTDRTIEQQPIDVVDPEDLVERDAIATAEEWLAAANAGDVGTMVEISTPTADVADERLFEWLAGLSANGLPTVVESCEAEPDGVAVRVRCQVVLVNPVAEELGVDRLVAPFRYADGFVTWRPYEGGDIGLVNEAFSAYLSRFEPGDYEEVCIPGAYDPGSIISDRRLALTGECAEVAGPLAGEVAQWIRDGRPEP